jgi:hypothetical protein
MKNGDEKITDNTTAIKPTIKKVLFHWYKNATKFEESNPS